MAYWFLFHHVNTLKKKADEIEQQGKQTSLRSAVKQDASLSDEQADVLETVSADCEQEVAQYDAKAKKIIDAFRARYADGKVPHGEKLPPPPPELAALQQQRNAAILRARDRLHAAMGDQEFQRMDAFVKKHNATAQPATSNTQ